MAKIKTIISLVLLCAIISLSVGTISCSRLRQGVRGGVKYATGDTYLALVDDSYVFMIMDDGKATYYRQYLQNSDVVEIGQIDNFFLSTKSTSMLDNSIYFSAAVQDDDNITTILYEIDLDKNKLNQVAQADNCSPDAYTFIHETSIAIAKSEFMDDDIRFYIDIYEPNNYGLSTVLEESINNETLDGKIILRAFSNNEHIYALTDEGKGNGELPVTSIDVFNMDYRKIESISISNIAEYIMRSRIYQMTVIGEYIYMSNLSNYSLFGRIENGNVTPIIMQRNLELANIEPQKGKIIMYLRSSNNIIILDSDTEQIEQITIETKGDYVIRCALANNSDIIIVLKSENNDDLVYYTTIEDLALLNSINP